MERDPALPNCGGCSITWKTKGAAHCWNLSDTSPAQPANCPAKHHEDILQSSYQHYRQDSEMARLAAAAAKVEGLSYQADPGSDVFTARWTRVEDTIALAKLMGYEKIGIATCIGLLEETRRFAAILQAQGLTPASICCKTGSIDKLEIGLPDDAKVRPGKFEPACNPIAQAEIFNRIGTDMNVIMGLCVGHDMLFAHHCKAPVTTLVAKDRVTGHNPVAVLYGQNFYYKRLLQRLLQPGVDGK